MYICRWVVLCETVVHDKTSNNLTMVNAITRIQSHSFPALYSRFAFAAVLDKQEEPGGRLSFRFVRETEAEDEILVTMKGEDPSPLTAQLFMNFPFGIRLLAEGTVTFRIDVREGEADWYNVGSQSIYVSAVAQQTEVSPDETASQEDNH